MIERNLVPALDFWVLQPLDERKKILDALKADVSLANHDFAGLPPQVWAGILAGLIPPAPPEEAETHGKKKRGE